MIDGQIRPSSNEVSKRETSENVKTAFIHFTVYTSVSGLLRIRIGAMGSVESLLLSPSMSIPMSSSCLFCCLVAVAADIRPGG